MARRLPLRAVVSLATVAVLLGAWWLVSGFGLVSPVFLPGPGAVLRKFVSVSETGYVGATLWQHLAASLFRVAAALAAAVVVGVSLGVAIATSQVGRGIFDPLIEFLRPIPPLAYLPLVIIWFGIGEPSKILVIFLAMLPPIALSTAAGVRATPANLVSAARSLGASRSEVLRLVALPAAAPSVLTGIRIALGAGWSTLVAAELIAANRGLGFMIQSASQFLVTEIVVMGIIVIALVAILLEAGFRTAERLLVPWSGRS